MYERRAALALGRDPKFLGVPFAAEWIRQRGHSMRTTIDAIVGTVQMSGIQQEAEQGLESGQLTEASAEAFFEAKKGQITESLWKLNVLDMEGTLTRVVDRVGAHLALHTVHWQCINQVVQGSCDLMSPWSDAVLCCAVLCCAAPCCAMLRTTVLCCAN